MRDFILTNKKLVCFTLLLFVTSIFLNGCYCDMYAGRRPFDYPNSVWVCEEPYISVTVKPSKETTAHLGSGSDAQEFQLLFGYGTDVDAIKAGTQMISDETILFQGDCVFGKKSFTIFLTNDNLWDEKYSKLRFDRIS